MDYVKLNKSRHKVKNFDGKKITTVDVKQIISAASLAPSAHNIQSWHFVIVESEEKREALLSEVDPGNHEQIKQAKGQCLFDPINVYVFSLEQPYT